MKYTADQLIAVAKQEVGYHEKSSNSQLDGKDSNSGGNNYTKYSRDLAAAGYYNGDKQGCAWCNVFVDWCFYTLCGHNKIQAQTLSCQTGDCGACCSYSAGYYKQQGRFDNIPKAGDQIYFYYSGDINHTGIVSKVEGDKVYTIEGNSSDQVAERSYNTSNSVIAGYGHPKYNEESGSGSYNPTVVTPTESSDKPTLKFGDTGIYVVTLQSMLQDLGYSVGSSGADGEFGYSTKSAVLKFQNQYGLEADGVVGEATWNKLEEVHDNPDKVEDQKADTVPIPTILNEEEIWNKLQSLGYNDYATAGIMGNMFAESNLKSNNLQDVYEGRLGYTDTSYTKAVDDGSYKNFSSDYAGYGLCQWTLNSRKLNLLAYAQSNSESIADTAMQLEFFDRELKSDYYQVYTSLINSTSVLDASNEILLKYERPADMSEKTQALRASYGQKYYDKYKASGTITDNPNGYPTISYGDKGSYVKELQEKLIKLGYSVGKDGADGEFGVDTKQAVISFQQKNGLVVDGVVGTNTWTVINNQIDSLSESSSSGFPELSQGNSGDQVKKLQTMLNKLGYNCGEVDGEFGSKTVAALMRFQNTHDLCGNGICNEATWKALIGEYEKCGSGEADVLYKVT